MHSPKTLTPKKNYLGAALNRVHEHVKGLQNRLQEKKQNTTEMVVSLWWTQRDAVPEGYIDSGMLSKKKLKAPYHSHTRYHDLEHMGDENRIARGTDYIDSARTILMQSIGQTSNRQHHSTIRNILRSFRESITLFVNNIENLEANQKNGASHPNNYGNMALPVREEFRAYALNIRMTLRKLPPIIEAAEEILRSQYEALAQVNLRRYLELEFELQSLGHQEKLVEALESLQRLAKSGVSSAKAWLIGHRDEVIKDIHENISESEVRFLNSIAEAINSVETLGLILDSDRFSGLADVSEILARLGKIEQSADLELTERDMLEIEYLKNLDS